MPQRAASFLPSRGMVAGLLIEACLIFLFDMIRITKDPRRMVEGDTVFREIFCRFARIPFDGHTCIMRVTRSPVKFGASWRRGDCPRLGPNSSADSFCMELNVAR